ncbi:MAG TPA: ABC transporter permease [Bryobacteraceae bacterium]|jgi:putative ABC transport system permease protein|nr:ABC transporter permease [Bryobacteraceae bacterium]
MWQWLKRKRPPDGEIDEELEYHVAMLAAEQRDRGDNSSAAQDFAKRKTGNVTLIKESTREAWRTPWLEEAQRDLHFTARMFARAPFFYSLVISILALGITASVSLFSLVDGVLLRPLPYRDPSRLVALTSYAPKPPYESNGSVSYRDYQFISREASSFSEIAVTYRTGWSRVTLLGNDEPTQLQGAFVSPNLFSVFGRQPLLGRTFDAEENTHAERVVVISESLWAQRFAASPTVIGKDLRFSGGLWRIIGVMPDDFHVPFLQTQLWAPILSHPDWNNHADGDPLNESRWDLLARLKPGVSLARSQAEINSIAERLKTSSPDNTNSLKVVPLREHFAGATKTPLLILFAAVGLLLSIACINVTNLLLARASHRQTELAIRTSLGAGRGRLLRQLLTETLTLSAIAAALGIAGAVALVPVLTHSAPTSIPMLDSVEVNERVLFFAAGLSILIGIMLGAATAWRLNNTSGLKENSRTSTETRKTVRLKSLLVASEFALATVLTSAALMLIRSFIAVLSVDPGFPPEKVLTLRLAVPVETSAAQVTQFYSDAFARFAQLPGVRATGGISSLFYTDESRVHALRLVEGHAPEPTAKWKPLVWSQIGGDYFPAIGIPLLRGRFFTARDTPSSPPVAIVNQTLARRYWPGEDPIGKHLKGFDPRGRHDDWLTIVGVVKDTHSGGLEKNPFSQIYEVQSQRGDQLNNLVIRTSGDPAALASATRSIVRKLNHNTVIANVSTMEQLLTAQTAGRRFQTWLIGVFSTLALGLAALGVFAVMHYSVAVRTNELGIRMALGANPGEILLLIIGDGTQLAFIGVLLGALGSVWSSHAIGSLLYQIRPLDPLNLVATLMVPLLMALLACYLPALRASRIDPMKALREE